MSCVTDVSHDNPYDPLSPSYTGTGSLAGTVVLLNKPSAVLVGVIVSASPAGIATKTDSSGYFAFPQLAEGKQSLIFSKSGYVTDTVVAIVDVGQKSFVNVSMNALPVFSDMHIVVNKIDQWWPGVEYSAMIYASVADPNGNVELDSVWFVEEEDTLSMVYNITDKKYELNIAPSDLQSGTMEYLVGIPLRIRAQDMHGAVAQSDPFYVKRIIQDEITPAYPISSDTVTFPFQMMWNAPDDLFSYTYTVKVVRVQSGTQTLVNTTSSIPADVLVLTFGKNSPISFSSGIYFWTVAVVDDYGNSSRSKESYFIVP
jgi:hypothetical protein